MKSVLAVLLVIALVAGAAAAWIYFGIQRPYRGYSSAEQFVEIPQGLGPRAIADRLVNAGVVRDRITFRAALWREGRATKLRAGEYRFTDPMTPLEVIEKLRRGDVFVIPITFPEGLNVKEMAKIFESKGFGTAESFVDAARKLEGYLFPDTYAVPRRTDAAKIVHLMHDSFERALTPAIRAAATARGLTIQQL